ncbi:hypothetical protein AGRA3207_004423 [Actinomadura graeca]|uniref:Uncharacterized protein n=1 Tax=Actinomadura graeca TaxID=2750812 RepID=A0ABX8QWR4_9ACTN|nr:hypothetical protein [Actinomadura graeca]QXJ23286.1 hypothetical protein AGRA3207_004423 [Actinomadura graeca]
MEYTAIVAGAPGTEPDGVADGGYKVNLVVGGVHRGGDRLLRVTGMVDYNGAPAVLSPWGWCGGG